MKVHNALKDDEGQDWEFSYTETMLRAVDPRGEEIVKDGRPVLTSRVEDFKFRPVAEEESPGEWQALPPWADVKPDWKITLCFFDEDEEGEITYWEVKS